MIQWMHALSKSWVATLLMGGLSLSFVLWGIGDIFQGGIGTSVAVVGSTEISQNAFSRAYRNLVRNQGAQMGTDITPEMAQKMGLGQVALQQMISRTALDNAAADLGLTTSDAAVAEEVRTMSAFRGASGQFDRATFQQAIQNAGYTEQQFLDELRQDKTRTQLTDAVESNFILPAAYAEGLFLYINERRAADYVVLPPDAAGTIAPPSDKQLEEYVKANAARYSTPEYRAADYAVIGPADVSGQITVTDAQIKQQYEAMKDTYVVPEKRDVQQIEFKTEAEAKAARQKIDSGTSFDQLAAQRGLKPADISLGTLTETGIPDPARAKAIFALPLNQVSQPLKTAFGSWVLARVTKIEAGSSRTLEEATPEIRKTLQDQLAQAKLVDAVNAYSDARNSGDDLAEAAKKAGMRVEHLKAVDSGGMAPDGTRSSAPADPEFLSALFAADVGEDGDPFNTKLGNYYVIHVNGVTPPKLKPLDQVRDGALATWTAEQRSKILSEKAKALAAQVTKDKSLDGVAKQLGASVQHSPALSRQTNDAVFSASLVQELFNAPPGGVVWGPEGMTGNFVIARVSGIVHPPVNPNDPGYAQGAAQLSRAVASDFTISLANAARERQGVKVNQQLVNSTIGSGGY
jgi:peptidyl-prolyl cis-trans isomerase D